MLCQCHVSVAADNGARDRAAAWAVEMGIVTDTSALSGAGIRGMLATMLWAAKDMPQVENIYSFADADGYILNAENYVVQQGWMSAQQEGWFGTKNPCTKEEVALAVWKAAGTPGGGAPSAYVDLSSDETTAAVNWLSSIKAIDGFTATMFCPSATATGLQIAKAVYKGLLHSASRDVYGSPAEYWMAGAFSEGYDGSASTAYDLTAEQLIAATARVAEEARMRGYRYGNSTCMPPTDDGIISCDRLIAKALWYLGLQDQTRGGITCGNMEPYLISHGWVASYNDYSAIRYGSIMLVNDKHHAYVVLSFDQATHTTIKFDTGSDRRIQSQQPFINEPWYYGNRNFIVFNLPSEM
ncbi:MAG: hypothetical protein Q4B26_01475 [Eubacteriales bacterium]|nr:hypothetical protein [Eubacteriales bacterium]